MIQFALIMTLGSFGSDLAACESKAAEVMAIMQDSATVSCAFLMPEVSAPATLRPVARPDDLCRAPCSAMRPIARNDE